MLKLFRRVFFAIYDFVFFHIALASFGAICLTWTALVLPVLPLMPRNMARRAMRLAITSGFRCFIGILRLSGRIHIELDELDSLRDEKSLIIACNHPSLWDAVLMLSCLPNIACIMKAQVSNNLFVGLGARLACYIRNESSREMIRQAVAELQSGSQILLFPEGTRTVRHPINPLKSSIGIIANRARVPVQTVIIETDSDFLSKGWPAFRKPPMPMTWRVRLGRRFQPGEDSAALVAEIEQYFADEIPKNRLSPKSAASRAQPETACPANISETS